MIFESLKDKCRYYQGLADYKLLPNSFVLCHIDGRAFSKMVKNRFGQPFDSSFIEMMNDTAKYLCKEVQGCKMAYVQSDEITLVLVDFDTEGEKGDGFFGYRLCKMQSIISSLATSYFNKAMIIHNYWEGHNSSANYDPDCEGEPTYTAKQVCQNIENMPLYQFDCKCWNVPSANDAFAWILYRQIDCVRNSKQQAAQTYCSYKELVRLDTDKQINVLKNKTGIDWYTAYNDGEKYGRFIRKTTEHMKKVINGKETEFDRSVWVAENGFLLNDENNREKFFEWYPILKRK